MKKNTPYAYVSVSTGHGYGHVNVFVHDLFNESGPTLKISCQTGGLQSEYSYAWEFGLSHDFGVIGQEACHQGYLLLRRMNKTLNQQQQELGFPESFAEFAIRALHAARVKDVYYNSDLAGRIAGYGGIKSLPLLDSRKNSDTLKESIFALESSLLLKTSGGL